MKDFYSERLKTISDKKTRSLRETFLPKQRPENLKIDEGLTTLAGSPRKPNPETGAPEMPASPFKNMFDHFNQDPSFKQGIDEFLGKMEVMREELNGIELPPEMLERRVNSLLDQYQKQAMAMNSQSQPQGVISGMPENVPVQIESPEQAIDSSQRIPIPNNPMPQGGM